MAKKPQPIFDELASAGASRIGDGYTSELAPSRDEVLELHGGGDLSLYERLLRDDQVYPTFLQRRSAVVAREWKVDAGGPSELDQRAADFMRDQLQRSAWDGVTFRMLAGLMYGFAVGECMWGMQDGKVVLDSIKVRKSKRFRFGTDGSLRLIKRGEPAGEVMPERKFWVFTAGADDDDDLYGRGLGHYLYWPVWFKRNALQFWALFLERFAVPTPMAKIPAGSTPQERNKFLQLLSAIRNGGRVVVPNGVDIQLLQALKDSGGDFDRFVGRMDASIAKIVLTQTMTTDDGSSYSQGAVHERSMGRVTKSDGDLVCESFTHGPSKWLTEWNFPGAAPPIVYRDMAEAEDLAARATRDRTIFELGFKPTLDYIQETYGDGFEPRPDPPPMAGFGGPSFAETLPAVGDSIDDHLDEEGWRKVIGPEVGAIETLLAKCKSIEEFRDRIGELALSDPKPLAESLARLTFAARVAGQVSAEPSDGEHG